MHSSYAFDKYFMVGEKSVGNKNQNNANLDIPELGSLSAWYLRNIC